ncbi:MAG TPA: DUF445 family protein [Calditerricola sp.]
MSAVLEIGFGALVGAFIGGATNYLAIRMLFRPHVPWRIGRWTLPFTPGLIPKRRGELARQLGELVARHLVTAQGLRRAMASPAWRNAVEAHVRARLRQARVDDRPLRAVVAALPDEVRRKALRLFLRLAREGEAAAMAALRRWVTEKGAQPLGVLVPPAVRERAERLAERAAPHVAHELASFLASERGRRELARAYREVMAQRGVVGALAGALLSEERVGQGLSRLLADGLRRPAAVDALSRVLRALVAELWRRPAAAFLAVLPERSSGDLVPCLLRVLASSRLGEVTLCDLLRHVPARVVDVWLPAIAVTVLDGLSAHMERLLASLPLAEAVRHEVEAFSLPELEARIVEVAGHELRWITLLGAVIGSVVGAAQTAIVLGLG